MKLLKILTHISMVLFIVGITLLISRGLVIKDFVTAYHGIIDSTLEYTSIVYTTRLNVEGIVLSVSGLVSLICFVIIRGVSK